MKSNMYQDIMITYHLNEKCDRKLFFYKKSEKFEKILLPLRQIEKLVTILSIKGLVLFRKSL